MIYGVDIHPRYQAGISIEQIRAEGFDFMAVKVCEGTDSSFLDVGAANWLRHGKACGLLCLGYHYLHAGSEAAQARTFVAALNAAGVPGMLDVEAGSGDIRNVRAFLDACFALGRQIPLVYLPRWYWQQIGSPDLTGLPALWASHYVQGEGSAAALYGQVPGSWWAGYGNGRVEVLQFTDHATVAGQRIDANAYRGTRDQFAGLIDPEPLPPPNLPIHRTLEDSEMYIKTDAPATGVAKRNWPTQRISVGFDPRGGWGGNLNINLHWTAPGGWIHEAKWWVRGGGTGVGVPNQPHSPVPIDVSGVAERFVGLGWELYPPDRADELEVVISAPGGCHIFPFYEK